MAQAQAHKRISRIPQNTAIVIAAVTLVVGFFVGRATAPKGDKAGPEVVQPAGEGGGQGAVAARGAYTEKKLDLPASPAKGPADAPVVIWEVSDFQCPFCSRAKATADQVLAAYPSDVQLFFKHRPLSFHKDARPAAIASMAAANQGHFWKYHDLLFANQKALGQADLVKYAQQLGMDMAQFNKDLSDPKLALRVDADDDAAVALGITGTPGFIVNGVFLKGAKPFEEFKAEIDKQLAKAKELEGQGVPRAQIARRLTAQAGGQAAQVVKYFFDDNLAPKQQQAPEQAAKQDDTTTVWKVAVDLAKDARFGPEHAPVTIAEFSDFECPFCSKQTPVYKQIKETYGDKVRIFFKHNPLSFHKNAPLAAQASLAANLQGKFWEMHGKLFENQKALTRPDVERYAQEIGLDMAKFKVDVDSQALKDQIAVDQAVAEKVQAQGTPNAFINGRKLTGAKPFEEFKTIIDDELAKSAKLLAAGTKLEALYDTLTAKGKTFEVLDPKVNQIAVLEDTPYKGGAGAKIVVAEYSDFQ
jgi:protein-disulfide isomerase